MTARVVLSCDGDRHGQSCRGAIPVGAVLNGAQARYQAGREGWSSALVGNVVRDLCPACTKRALEGRR